MTITPPRQSAAERLRAEHGAAHTLGDDCDLPDDLAVEIDPGAHLTLGNRVSTRRGSTIQVHRGATVAIGEHTFISAMAGIRIGTNAMVGANAFVSHNIAPTPSPPASWPPPAEHLTVPPPRARIPAP